MEELETANEELKSSNEEMMSMNEELQSTNEELSTVNDELKSKVDQLTLANSDLRNFFDSTALAVVVLDSKLCLRSYTEPSQQVFPLQPSDRGRPLEHVASRLATHDYLEDARAVAGGAPAIQRRVTSRDGERTYSLRTLPYRRHDGAVDGVTLVLTEITDALAMERSLAAERERLDMAIKAGGIGIWQYHVATGRTELDETERVMLNLSQRDAGHIDNQLARVVEDDRAAVNAALRRAVAGEDDLDVGFRIIGPDGSARHIKSFGRLMERDDDSWLVGMSIDVTPEYALAETRAVMLREMNHRVKNLFAIIGSMISMGARSHTDLRVFARDMRERIEGLGRAHSLASATLEDQPIALRDLIETTLLPYRDRASMRIDGPALTLDRRYLSPMALMLHEWATNSVKYGALGHAGAELAIVWHRSGSDLELHWNETLLDAADNRQEGKGFGTLLVETAARQLNAHVERSLQAHEFALTVRMPTSLFDV